MSRTYISKSLRQLVEERANYRPFPLTMIFPLPLLQTLQTARRIAVLTSVGISAESTTLPTYPPQS